MELYLRETARKLKSNVGGLRIVVSGNEACDLDSTVCALAYAMFKQMQLGESALIIPLCYVNRADMHLRSEVVYWLNRCHICLNSLIYADDLLLTNLEPDDCETQLILVDHNKPTGPLADTQWPVVEIIDHHQLESAENQQLENCRLKRVELVGSCASLVTQLLLQSELVDRIPSVVWELLYGAILIDTVGLSVKGQKAGRLTNLDLLMATRIEDRIGYNMLIDSTFRESLYSAMEEAKFDVKAMSTWDLIRRDTKLACGLEGSTERLVCSTVSGLDFVDLVRAPDFVEMANRLCALHSATVVVCITVGYATTEVDQSKSTKERRRGLVVYSPTKQPALCGQLVSALCNPKHKLELHPEPVDHSAPVAFTGIIHNPTVTRKAVMPILIHFVNRHRQPPAPPIEKLDLTPMNTAESTTDTDSKRTNKDPGTHAIRSLDPNIQRELEFLRSWLASFDSNERFKLVCNTVSSVMETLRTDHPSVELLKQVASQLTERARADQHLEGKLTAVPTLHRRREPVDGEKTGGSLVEGRAISDIGKALNRGRRLTMPATNDLRAYHERKRRETTKLKFRGASDDSHSLPDNEDRKPTWLETEYLTRLSSWLPDHIQKTSVEAIEAVSYRLYRRLSSVPQCGQTRPATSVTFDFEPADDNFSEPMDDAELALLRNSFGDIQRICSTDDANKGGREKSTSLLPSTSWPFAENDAVFRRGLEWLRRSPKVNRPRSGSKPTTPSPMSSLQGAHSHVKFMLNPAYKTSDDFHHSAPGETSGD
ncbi:hypothetical protein D915_002869 [Fasciola hepatica]|uniref:DHHA2 domain-containing protein n=1 Tax=Fasciola hepatica TaxID=6192 RepID=A0A4E0RFK4_FASHE|nr:hypothetical protein D915_002869 [Fasciola hepatica]